MSKKFKKLDREKIHQIYRDSQKERNAIVPLIVICGPGKCEEGPCEDCPQPKKDECLYYERKRLEQELIDQDCLPCIFEEEELDLQIASLEETIILRQEDVDKIIVIPDSKGSSSELAIFARNGRIRPKLIVLVPYRFHPLYSDSESFLTSLYKELIGIHGHVYPFDLTGELHPTPSRIITLIMQSYRLHKLAQINNE